jgi:hypothetical protein
MGEFVSNDVEGHDLVAGTDIVLRFNEGELSASAGVTRSATAHR